jgi:hypothetical protein
MRHRFAIVAAALLVTVIGANAQSPTPSPSQAAATAGGSAAPTATAAVMQKLASHYVEGAGYVTFFHNQTKGYGGTYAECEKNCLADARCKMIEFYKPLRKCHLYDHIKWSGKSKDAEVALKKGS